MANLGTP
jgi:hypothetical protein